MSNELLFEFAFDIRIKVEPGKGFEAGDTAKGLRRMIPITGGTFEGPNIKGTVIPGGPPHGPGQNRSTAESVGVVRWWRLSDGMCA